MTAEKIFPSTAAPVSDSLLTKLEQLSPDLLQQVEDFVQLLVEKRSYQKPERLNPQLRGAIRELGEEYTSVELQHQALDWWTDTDEVPS